MTTPEADQPETAEQQQLPIDPQAENPTEGEPSDEQAADEKADDLPEWAKEKIRKSNSEAKNLRARLKEQEPLVAAAQEAERAKMTELDRERADNQALKEQLAQRDQELLMARYQIPDDYVEFLLTEGTFEEKEARAKKVGEMVQSKSEPQDRPPSDRPVESLRPGASPSTPPPVDHSYPANWGYQPADS